ncbi:MAG: hypothetical protein LUD47_01910, partial [Clostridia bacterium]|nr:hypothetical protein [Clostridia bacterium]
MGSIRSKRKWISKIALLTVAALATTSLCGLLAGCKGNSDDEDETEAKSNPDTQLLKNGNFEFYEDNDGDFIYYTPDNWSKTSTGTTSYTASGIINTAPDQWDRMTSLQTAVKLYVNDLLSTYNSDDDLSSKYSDTYDDYHVEYAGLKDYDLLYKDPATVIDVLDNLEDFADDDENTLTPSRFKELLGDGGEDALQAVVDEYLLGTRGNYITEDNKDDVLPGDEDIYIDNPNTHDKVIFIDEDDGTYKFAATEYLKENGNNSDIHDIYKKTDEDDDDYDTKLYTNEDCTDALESSVLMIHNYLKNGNGTSQYYGASTTITLEANTAAKISVWVKTSDLYYHGYTPVKQNRGAYISVTQSVGSTSLDNFKINSINTEKINPKPTEEDENQEWENNGWVKYTVYVQACDYAETTVSINLGLGGTENGGVCEGYAFFDDVEV